MIKKTSRIKRTLPIIILLGFLLVIIGVFVNNIVNMRRKIRELEKNLITAQRKTEKLRVSSPYLDEIFMNSGSLTSPQYVLKVRLTGDSAFLLVMDMDSFIGMVEHFGKHSNWYIAALYWTMKMDTSTEDGIAFDFSKDVSRKLSHGLVPWSDYQAFVKESTKLSLADFLNKYFVDKGSYWQMKKELMERSDTRPRRDLMVIGYLARHFHVVVYRADYSGRYFVRKNESKNSLAPHPKAMKE